MDFVVLVCTHSVHIVLGEQRLCFFQVAQMAADHYFVEQDQLSAHHIEVRIVTPVCEDRLPGGQHVIDRQYLCQHIGQDLLQELGRLLSQVKAQLLPAVNAPEAGAQGAIVFVVIPLQRRRGKGALVALRYADAEIDPYLLCGARGRQTALEVDDLRQIAGNKAVQ